MRIRKISLARLAVSAACAALLAACSGTETATRSLTPEARSSDVFVASGPPTVSAVIPANGPTAGGNTVTLSGTQFENGYLHISVNGLTVAPTVVSPTTATFKMLAGEGSSAVISVWNQYGMAQASTYSYDPPSLASVSPSSGAWAGGDYITLSGNNFGLHPQVMFGSTQMGVTSATHTRITVFNAGGTPGQVVPVTVRAANQTSTDVQNFSYTTPTITSITSDHAPTYGGVPVTITGTGFGYNKPTVTLGGAPVNIVRWSETSIVIYTPVGEGQNLPLAVVTSGVSSNTVPFSFDAPTVTSVSPSSGPISGGTPITISGANFGLSGTVTIGGAIAPITTRSQGSIIATTPPGLAGPAPVVVTVLTRSTDGAVKFNYVAPKPNIVNVIPNVGPTAGGVPVTLTGSNFGSAPTVTVGGAVAPIVNANDTQLAFMLPAGEGIAPIVVSASGVPSDASTFNYSAPAIAAIAPATGSSAGGYAITLSGSNFGLHPTVTFGASNATITAHSHSAVVFTAPAGEPGQDVAVSLTVAGQVSNTRSFHYGNPTLNAITPSHGSTSGGTVITLTGGGFGSNPGVLFNGAAVTPLSVSQSQITFASPAGQGSANVIVTGGATQSNARRFEYDAPTITSLSPASGLVAGGTQITISGSNFGLTPTVTFGGASAPLVSSTHTRLVVTSPAGTPTSVPVLVSVAGKPSNTMSYQYICPDGTVISNDACVTPVAALGNVVASLPAEAQTQLAPIVSEITSKLTDNNASNDNGACGQLNAVSKQTAALLKSGKISSADASALQSLVTLVSGKAGCK